MKNILTIIILTFGLTTITNAQGITNTLGGDTSTDKFVVESHRGTPLLTVTGEGKVGIGITDPNQKLDINGTAQMTGFNLPTGAANGLVLTSNSSGTGTWQAVPTGSSLWTESGANVYRSGGNVGIGTTNPVTKLDVRSPSGSGSNLRLYSGTVATHSFYNSSGDNARTVMRDASDNITIALRTDRESYFNGGDVGIGTTSPGALLHVDSPVSAGTLLEVSSGTFPSENNLVVKGDGNAGIGTANPSAKLDVIGDLRVTGAYRGNIGPNNGAPFPRPAYDSGWLPMDPGTGIELNHGIGGNVDNYFVDLWFESIAWGRNQFNYGSSNDNKGAFWHNLTNSRIRVYRTSDDPGANQVRVRIWVYN